MISYRKYVPLALVALAVVYLPGCQFNYVPVNATVSPDVAGIPSIVGVYPLLSSPVEPRGAVRLQTLSKAGQSSDEAYVVPPAETRIVHTQQSQVMTDLLSTELSERGFRLKQIPIEVPGDGDDSSGGFAVSMGLLRELHDEYGLGALVIGNVFFVADPSDRSMHVSVAYLKIIDVETLDVLAQLNGVYDRPGPSLGEVAAALANEMAVLAGLKETGER